MRRNKALALIELAHPDFRESLLDEAKRQSPVTAGDTVAFATALLRCGSKEELAKDSAPRLRLTIGLRKIDGAWKIAHEHHSFPLDL